MRTKRFHSSIPRRVLIGMLLAAVASQAQPAKGANKFLGNITTNNAVRSDFLKYWNQITPENEGKWGTVEGTRGTYKFAGIDSVKNFAERNNIPWKLHCLVWGSQYPNWLTSLSTADQLAAITKWMDTLVARYPNAPMIDVVNEAYPGHKPAPFSAALGGKGTTGFDWIIKSFQMARERWPKAILIYNDYNIIEYSAENKWMDTLLNAMIGAHAPIDAIGCQAHDAYKVATATVQKYMDNIAAHGLPLFITEFDIQQTVDSTQLNNMKDKMSLFWNYPKVVGVTYWGYLVGSTWRNGTGLLNTNGTERPALTWLKGYIADNPTPPNDFPKMLNLGTTGIRPQPQNQATRPSAVVRSGSGTRVVFDLQGRKVATLDRARSVSSKTLSPRSYVVKNGNRSEGLLNKVR